MNENNSVIGIRHLEKSFGETHVLKDINLELQSGENVVVLGKSGCGKSVLIKCIVGLIKPDAGELQVFGENIFSLDHRELDQTREKIGFVFQSSALYDSMTVRENLEFPLRRHKRSKSKKEITTLVEEALHNVGLPEAIDKMPAELSGGMKKRIGLARALILKPEIMLYDEPTTGLDPITGKEIITLMVDVQKKYHTSSIIISHDMHCAQRVADRVYVMIDGIFYATGKFEELKNSKDEKVKVFFA